MGRVVVTPADSAFSKCIRQRDGWTCQRCGGQYELGTQALHCSHWHGRGSWSLRFNPDNCDAMCYGCHMHLTANPMLHRDWQIERKGEGLLQILQELSNDTTLGRYIKKNKTEYAAHYRAEFRRLQKTGSTEFENWS